MGALAGLGVPGRLGVCEEKRATRVYLGDLGYKRRNEPDQRGFQQHREHQDHSSYEKGQLLEKQHWEYKDGSSCERERSSSSGGISSTRTIGKRRSDTPPSTRTTVRSRTVGCTRRHTKVGSLRTKPRAQVLTWVRTTARTAGPMTSRTEPGM